MKWKQTIKQTTKIEKNVIKSYWPVISADVAAEIAEIADTLYMCLFFWQGVDDCKKLPKMVIAKDWSRHDLCGCYAIEA